MQKFFGQNILNYHNHNLLTHKAEIILNFQKK